jgi:single-stranded DNA-binding protein
LESAFSKTLIMEVTGKIKVINPEQQVSASFRKRELVVATEEQYPQFISINFVQDKCDLLNSYNVGEAVKVSINLRGREWVNPQGETKYFNDIQGWRIERLQAEAPAAAPAAMAPMPAAETFAPATNFNEEEHDDLPF